MNLVAAVQMQWSIVILAVFFVISVAPAIMLFAKARRSSTELLSGSSRTAPYLILAGIWANWIWLGGLLGAGEGGFLFGMPASWAYPLGWWLSMFIFVGMVKRLRRILPGATTHVQFMQWRFDRKNRVLYALGTIAILFASLVVNLVGVGIAFQAIGNVPYWLAILCVGGTVIVYVAISGLWAVNVTCFMQTIIIGVFALIIVPLVIFKAGGPSAIQSALDSQGVSNFGNIVNKGVLMAFLVPQTLAYIFFAQTDPSVWQKGFAVSRRSLARALLIGVSGAFLLDACVSLMGVAGKAFLPADTSSYFAVPLAIDKFAPYMSWAFLVMCLCAMLSTGASLLNAATTYLTKDFLEPFIYSKRSLTDRAEMRWANVLTVVVGGVSILAAIGLEGASLLGLIVVLGVVISCFAIPVTMGLYWKRTNRQGVFAGTIGACIVSLVLYFAVWGGALWSANLWKIMLINFGVTLFVPLLWSLASPDDFDYERARVEKPIYDERTEYDVVAAAPPETASA